MATPNYPADQAEITRQIEDLLVARNLRGMKTVQPALTPGYYQRAAKTLFDCKGTVLIGTGFPVVDTFETDGPVGAIALYDTLKYMGAEPVIVCGGPLAKALSVDYQVHEISVGDLTNAQAETEAALAKLQPEAVISIERPGLSTEGGYFNMRGEDISPRCACFDYFVTLAECPTIAIGDGGNEIGMGNISEAISQLDITASATTCDELLIADVSNWAAHGLIALWGLWRGEDLLSRINTFDILTYISDRGSVDGVTRSNTLTEDSLEASVGQELIETLREITGFSTPE